VSTVRIIAVIVIVIVAGFMIWNGLNDAHEARVSASWPVADGKVLSHSVKRVEHYERYSNPPPTWEPMVWYAYAVGGEEYKDSRIAWYKQDFHSEGAANEYMKERFPIEGTVRVHYDPNHPHHACLVPGGSSRAMVSAYVGLAILVVTVLVVGFLLVRGPR
jgi:hypothetical protein